jgi:uncharacterized membrane protein
LVLIDMLDRIFAQSFPFKEKQIMRAQHRTPVFRPGLAIFNLLDPIPFGFFVAAMIFDIIYSKSGDMLWIKASAWLVSLGLIFAIIPRFINLYHVWFGRRRTLRPVKLDFWLNALAIITALLNAFVHSRDAYAAIPEAVWLSIATVVLMAIGRIMLATDDVSYEEVGHE